MEEKSVLERFLLDFFEVQELYQIDPWKYVGPVNCWEPARDVTVKSIHKGPGESHVVAKKGVRNPFHNRDYDFTRVNLRSWQCIYAKTGANNCIVQSNFVPVVFKAQIEQQDKMLAAAGVPEGTVMRIAPNFDGATADSIFNSTESTWLLSKGFCRTMACVNQQNLMNGVIKLAPEVCVDLPKEVEVATPEGLMRTIDIKYYVLIPHGHVLTWKLRIDGEWRKQKGMFALDMSCLDPDRPQEPRFLYHVVCDDTFAMLVMQCMTHWMNKVDLRPMDSLALKMDHEATLRTVVTCTVWPQMSTEDVQSLRPTLHESIRPYYEILQEEMHKKLMSQ